MNRTVVAVLAAWVALELTRGSVGLDHSFGMHTFLADSTRNVLAGGCLLLWAAGTGRLHLPDAREWGLLLGLAGVTAWGLVLWRPYVDGWLGLRHAKSAEQGMVLLAAPLWLGLLGALRWVPEEAPRRAAAATLAAIAGWCLLLTGEQLAPTWAEAPVLALTVVQGVALVWVWSAARRTFQGWRTTAVAGWALLALGAVDGVVGAVTKAPDGQAFAWRMAWEPLLLTTILTGAAALAWWWLLSHITLAAFAMQEVALWFGSLAFAFGMFGFLNWRVDLAVALGLWALWTGLGATAEDDAPVRLGVV